MRSCARNAGPFVPPFSSSQDLGGLVLRPLLFHEPSQATQKLEARLASPQLSLGSPVGCTCGYWFHRVAWLPGYALGGGEGLTCSARKAALVTAGAE